MGHQGWCCCAPGTPTHYMCVPDAHCRLLPPQKLLARQTPALQDIGDGQHLSGHTIIVTGPTRCAADRQCAASLADTPHGTQLDVGDADELMPLTAVSLVVWWLHLCSGIGWETAAELARRGAHGKAGRLPCRTGRAAALWTCAHAHTPLDLAYPQHAYSCGHP